MTELLDRHCIPFDTLRNDDFAGFYARRQKALLQLIEKTMGKSSSVPSAD
jgi:hypothetical protein